MTKYTKTNLAKEQLNNYFNFFFTAFVSASQTRRSFHTTMTFDSVKCVLIATSTAAQHGLQNKFGKN